MRRTRKLATSIWPQPKTNRNQKHQVSCAIPITGRPLTRRVLADITPPPQFGVAPARMIDATANGTTPLSELRQRRHHPSRAHHILDYIDSLISAAMTPKHSRQMFPSDAALHELICAIPSPHLTPSVVF